MTPLFLPRTSDSPTASPSHTSFLSPVRAFPRWQGVVLLLLALASTAMYGAFFFLPLLDPPNAERHVRWSLWLFALYLPFVAWARHLPKGALWWALVSLALLSRVLLWPHDPSMSDDAYRYLWDGKVQAHGLNPYEEPPTSLYLLHLRDPLIHPFINHPKMPTVYPPVAQAVFTGAYLLQPHGFVGLKALFVLFELVACWLMLSWLQSRGKPAGGLLLYLWCPLPILEISLDAHLDVMAMPFLLAILFAAAAKRGVAVGVLLALTILIKPLPIFWVPVLFVWLRWRQGWWMLASAFVTGLCLMLPYLQEWGNFLKQMGMYSRHWYFNGPFYTLLDIWLIKDANRLILSIIVLLASIGSAFLHIPLRWRLFLPMAVYMLFTPTLYPWYLLWLAPWLVIGPSRFLFGCVALIPLSHLVRTFKQLNGEWALPPAIMLLEFLPLLLLLSMDLRDIYRQRLRRARLFSSLSSGGL